MAFSGAKRMGEGFYRHGRTNALELTYYLGLAAADPDRWLGGAGEPTGTVYGEGHLLRGAVVCAANTSSLESVRRVLRRVLVPWALLGTDPLRG